MSLDPITAVFDLGSKILDKVIPDPAQRDAAKLELLKAQQAGQLDDAKIQLSAIISDSQSADPWTARARPSFLYTMYLLILWSIPMGVLSAFYPDRAAAIVTGMTNYLNSLPDSLYTLFGTGYLGYTAARQWGKVKGVDK
jgi:hypothetical protein